MMSVVHPPPAGEGEPIKRWADRWIEEIQGTLPEVPRHERPAVVARLSGMLLACARDDEADAVLMTARRQAVRGRHSRELARIEVALASAALARDDDEAARTRLASARALPLPPSIACRAWLVEARLERFTQGLASPSPPDPEVNGDDPLDPDERLELAAELALERARQARGGGRMTLAHTELAKAHEIVDRSGSERLIGAFEVESNRSRGACVRVADYAPEWSHVL